MEKTLIEESTNKRFATRFRVLENHRPTAESILVFKEFKDSPDFLVVEYYKTPEGEIKQIGSLQCISEAEFKTKYSAHVDWDTTSLKEFDNKWSDWRSSSLVDKLNLVEQSEEKELK